jgi:hypothetical protein
MSDSIDALREQMKPLLPGLLGVELLEATAGGSPAG